MAIFPALGNVHLGKITYRLTHHSPTFNGRARLEMESEQEEELFNLIFNEPLSQRSGWPIYQPPERSPSKSLRQYVSRLKEYQKQYFEEVEKRMKDKDNNRQPDSG